MDLTEVEARFYSRGIPTQPYDRAVIAIPLQVDGMNGRNPRVGWGKVRFPTSRGTRLVGEPD